MKKGEKMRQPRRPEGASMLTAALWNAELGGPGCWEWKASKDGLGYGTTWWGGRGWRTHRLHWIAINGPIQDGLELDHLCRNPACLRLSHLEPVPHRENCRRGLAGINYRSKTHCPYGHPYSGDNVQVYRFKRAGLDFRKCVSCSKVRAKKSYVRADKSVKKAMLESNRAFLSAPTE